MPAQPHQSAIEMAVGFDMGLYTRDDVGAWVDVEVERCEALVGPLLDLTTLNGKHDVDIEHLLFDLADRPSDNVRASVALGVLGEMVRRKQLTSRDAICQASRLAELISCSEYGAALSLEDQYYLAVAGIHGTLDEVERDIVAFFDRYNPVGDEP
ncbi:MAG: hypothetical protein ACHREM_02520 [Polyangiales bacterium]